MDWIALIPLLPALAFAALLPLPRRVRNRLRVLPVFAMTGAFSLAVAAFFKVWPGGEGAAEPVWNLSWMLASLGGRPLMLGIELDAIAAVMLVTVTFVGVCVQVYSLGYMHRDERVGWYYAVLSLFTSAMLVLVLADNLLLLFAMWEIMGLCSYLLIGFWYELEAPRKASQKAFLTTRVGDIGFLFALMAIFRTVGTFETAEVLASIPSWGPGVAAAIAAGLLWAAMGKSAQLPLHVWLPDAMAGPTPASALIHAATMVAAGVYLVARMLPVFEAAPVVLGLTLAIGAVTAVVAGLLASVQHDVKKVLAYSTISQLGLMFVGLGAGSALAGIFHLVTHAFFKSLLFLGAGVIIHSARTQDMREMGGLARYMPVTTAAFSAGALALAGIPPFAGFFSKDEILAVLWHGHHYIAFGAVLVASGLTAFYVTRLWFRVFSGPAQIEHLHDGHRSMLVPMGLLAIVTSVLGFGGQRFARFIGHEGGAIELPIAATALAVAGVGIAIAWWVYGRRSVVVNTRVYKQRMRTPYGVLVNKFLFDAVYDVLVIRPYLAFTGMLSTFDRSVIDGAVNGTAKGYVRLSGLSWRFDGSVVDGAINGLARITRRVGTSLRALQTGRLQSYQRYVLAAVVLLMLYIVVKGA